MRDKSQSGANSGQQQQSTASVKLCLSSAKIVSHWQSSCVSCDKFPAHMSSSYWANCCRWRRISGCQMARQTCATNRSRLTRTTTMMKDKNVRTEVEDETINQLSPIVEAANRWAQLKQTTTNKPVLESNREEELAHKTTRQVNYREAVWPRVTNALLLAVLILFNGAYNIKLIASSDSGASSPGKLLLLLLAVLASYYVIM